MSGLTFRLNAAPGERLDLSELTPGKLSRLSPAEISKIIVGTTKSRLTVGDLFTIAGSAGDSVTISGSTGHLDFIGTGLTGGKMIVEGDVGICAGRSMKGGTLDIRGDAGAFLAAGLSGGIVTVKGSAGSNAGGQWPGDQFGMAGGIVAIEGDAGDRVGDRMRRGTIVVRGSCGAEAASRMIGGTVWAERGFGPAPGMLLRRGTLIGPSVERMLSTFVDGGRHDLVVLRILSRYLKATLGPLAPNPISGAVHKFAGDLATIGKGEILLTA